MEALGYKEGENIKYTFKNAQGDMNTAPSIIQDFKSSKKDCVVAIATPVAQTAAEMSTDTPVVFAAVTDPIKAGLLHLSKNQIKILRERVMRFKLK